MLNALKKKERRASFQEDLGNMMAEKDSDLISSHKYIKATGEHRTAHSENKRLVKLMFHS